MFKLDMAALREAAQQARLMAKPATVANRAHEMPDSGSQLADIATVAVSQRKHAEAEDAVEWQAERAAILEFDAGLPHEDAVSHAAQMHAAWLLRDRVYQEHHFSCPTCIAAGQGRGLRCGVGAALWANYESAPRSFTD